MKINDFPEFLETVKSFPITKTTVVELNCIFFGEDKREIHDVNNWVIKKSFVISREQIWTLYEEYSSDQLRLIRNELIIVSIRTKVWIEGEVFPQDLIDIFSGILGLNLFNNNKTELNHRIFPSGFLMNFQNLKVLDGTSNQPLIFSDDLPNNNCVVVLRQNASTGIEKNTGIVDKKVFLKLKNLKYLETLGNNIDDLKILKNCKNLMHFSDDNYKYKIRFIEFRKKIETDITYDDSINKFWKHHRADLVAQIIDTVDKKFSIKLDSEQIRLFFDPAGQLMNFLFPNFVPYEVYLHLRPLLIERIPKIPS